MDLSSNVVGRNAPKAAQICDLLPAAPNSSVSDREVDVISASHSFLSDLNDVFEEISDSRFPCYENGGDRRTNFFDYVRSFSGVYADVRVIYPHGVNSVMNIAYFLVYNFLCMLNRQRGGFMDDEAIRNNTVIILNRCAEDDFTLLYELMFD